MGLRVHVCEVATRGIAARAHRKRRHHLTVADVYGRRLLGLFPGPVVERNVEPAVLRDVYASSVPITGPWYRGDRRRRSRGTFRTRDNSYMSSRHVAKERG